MNLKNRWIPPAIFFVILLGIVSLHAQVPPNPVPLINQPLVPTRATPGGADITLTVNGTGFVSGASVRWNGSTLATTFGDSGRLTAVVPAANIAIAGTASITVVNPSPGGGFSNVVFFPITAPTSSITLSRSDVATGVNPSGVAAADFNGDGNLDLVIANFGSDSVSILLGNGDGTFLAPVDHASGVGPVMTTAADFNADGILDLAVANISDDTVSILLGTGDGTFQNHIDYPAGELFTGVTPKWIATGDFNVDGTLDLAISNLSSNAGSILLGNGDGTFQTGSSFGTGGLPVEVTMGDFNADGKLDLAVANSFCCSTFSSDPVFILLGNGDGTFQGQLDVATGIAGFAVTTGDFNGDGKLDLAVATSQNNVSIQMGNGDGTFQSPVDYATGTNPQALAVADLNVDGRLDLAIANYSSNTVSILLGNGDGTFQTQTTYSIGVNPTGVTIGDFNGDGRPDLAVANFTNNTVSVLLQTGTPYLSQADSPFFASIQAGTTYLENFEDGLLNTLGVTASAGAPNGPGGSTDSVDADDGAIDGSGTNGRSFFFSPGSTGITFTFNDTTLGAFPTHAGIAWTDGTGTTTFEAFDNLGASLGVVGPVAIADGSINGTTGEDRFFGAVNPSGISAIHISNSSGGIEVDHLQYGPFAGASPLVFTPGSANFVDPIVVGDTSFGLNIVVSNTATFAVNIASISVTGDFATKIADTDCPISGGTLPAGQPCNLDLEFTPTSGGLRQGIAQIVSDASGSPHIIPLTGIGAGFGLPADTDTVALYKFEETSPGTSFDSSGHGNNAIDTGTTVIAGSFGNARQFNGISDHINMDAVRVALNGSTALSIEFVARSPSGSAAPAVLNHECGNGWQLRAEPTAVVYGIKTNAAGGCNWVQLIVVPAVIDTSWHYYALTWDGATLSVYRDGILLDSSPATGVFTPISPVGVTAEIGLDTFSNTFTAGELDEMRVSSAARSASEILATAQSFGLAAGASDPVAFINQPLVPTPTIVAPGSGAFTLTVNGTGFTPDSLVHWNGNPQTTSFVNAGQVTASIEAINAETATTAEVAVDNPAPGGSVRSNLVFFHVTNPKTSVSLTKTDFDTGGSPGFGGIAEGDFDGDGQDDLAVSQRISGNDFVSIFLGTGVGTFSAPMDFAVGGACCPSGIATGDFNADGKLDLAVANDSSNAVSILLGNGDGSFPAPVDFATAAGPSAVTPGDLNGDGKLDLAIRAGSMVSALLGNGNGTFQSHLDFATGSTGESLSIVMGDFNGDGKLDVAAANDNDDTVSVLLGIGDGSFQAATDFATGADPRSVTLGDFNGDGKLDLVTANRADSTVSILLGNGNGTFQANLDFASDVNPEPVTLGDFNGDGKLDVFTGNTDTQTGSILLGNGNGTFQAPINFATGNRPVGITTGDFNDDGQLDAATGNDFDGTFSVLLQPTPPPFDLLSPASLEFGGQAVGTTSAAKTVTLRNTGGLDLSITSIVITGTDSGDFARTTTCGTSLAADVSCTISVTFAPTALGTREASVTITDNAVGSPHTVALTGTGLPVLVLSETALTMPDTPINLTCVPRTVTLTNTSPGTVTFSSIATSSAEFIQTNTCGTTLGAGASCTVSVVFHPAAIGTRAGTLTIASNVEGSPQVVTLIGEGLPLCLLQAVVPSLKVVQGTDSVTFEIFHDAQGATELAEAPIGLACADAAPARCSFNPQTIAVTGRSTLRVENLRAVGGSSKALKVTGNSAQEKHTMWVQVLFADFSFTKYPNEASVKAGETASYAISIVPVNGLAGRMALKCTGVPVGTSCTVTPGEVTLEGAPVQVAVKVRTTQRGGIVRPPTEMAPPVAPVYDRRPEAPGTRLPILLWSLPVLLMAATGLAITKKVVTPAKAGAKLALGLALLCVLTWGSCGGGGGIGPEGWQGATPLGTHTLVIQGTLTTPGAGVATDSNTPPLTHETQITLKVK